ncbi:MAG TPA: hypothetical protein VMD08_17760 [Candidatus Baltobacteraceae bacterium]|nr:hypothetical protein [Candidatus Baltobacteraceae bacterium]
MEALLESAIDSLPANAAAYPLRYLTPSPSTFRNYKCCPWAKTIAYYDEATDQKRAAPINCKRWGCAYCAPRKIRKLAFLTHGANPNRWIRLGVLPSRYETPEAAWRHTSPLVPQLFRRLKKHYGEIEYLRVAEIHNGTTKYAELQDPGKALGFPHYHAMLRCGYIPQKALSETWGQMTEAPVVWISKIDQSFSSFRYLTKYLTKLHRLEWTDRHVSYSRNFFQPEDLERITFAPKRIIERSELHPWKYLTDHYGEQEIGINADNSFTLPDQEDAFQSDVPLHAFGLALPPAPTDTPRPAAVQNPLFDHQPIDTFVDDSF